MLGDPCRPQAQGDRCDRRSVRPLHPAWHPGSHPLRQRNGVRRRGRAGMDAAVGTKTAYIERGSRWENSYIESFNARLRDQLLNGEIFYSFAGGPDRHRELATPLQQDEAPTPHLESSHQRRRCSGPPSPAWPAADGTNRRTFGLVSCPMQNAPILLVETELTFFVLPPVPLCALWRR